MKERITIVKFASNDSSGNCLSDRKAQFGSWGTFRYVYAKKNVFLFTTI